jgi:hypothetical protein
MPVIGNAKLAILDLETKPGSTPVLVGAAQSDQRPLEIPIPKHDGSGTHCWSSPSR